MTARGALEPGRGMGSGRGLLRAVLLVGLTLLVYSPTIDGHFVADDFALFTEPLGAGGRNPLLSHTEFVRPIPRLSMRLDFLLFGSNTVPAHALNLLLHLWSTALLGALLLRFSASRAVAWSAALLFAVHPIHVGAVSWLAGRFDLFCTAFLLASALSYDTYVTRGRRRALGASLALFAGALLSKELAVGFPLALALYELLRPRGGGPPRWRALLAYLLLAALYLVLRVLLIGRIASPLERLPAPGEVLERVFVVPARVMTFPVNSLQWGALAPVLSTAIALILAAAAGFGLWHQRFRPSRGVWLGAGLLIVASLPMVTSLGGVQEGLAASRLFYLPSAGFCIVLGELLGGARPRTRGALLAALAAVYALTTFGNNLPWRTAAIWTERIPRQVAALYPTFGVERPILIVQDPPRRHRGAYVFLDRSLEKALELTLAEPHTTVVVERAARRTVDLRGFIGPAKVFALRWDPKREAIVDVTQRVRGALASILAEEPATLEWAAGDLSEWTLEPAGGAAGEGAFGWRMGAGPLVLSSPLLPRGTGVLELELSLAPLEPPRELPVLPMLTVTWWTSGRPPGLYRVSRIPKADGVTHAYRIPTTLRCFEDLQGDGLRARVHLTAPGCRVEILRIRALPFERRQ